MPDVDVMVISETSDSTSSEKPVTGLEDFPALPEGAIVVDAMETETVKETDSLPKLPEDANVVVVEEGKKESAPEKSPEKTPKKHLSEWERARLKEEKKKKIRELNALRYLAQANPGSIPVSESMKANSFEDEDEDESSDINVHVGVDEATVSALYNGMIETPTRQSPSRRIHESPSRHASGRNAGIRSQRGEDSSRYVSRDGSRHQKSEDLSRYMDNDSAQNMRPAEVRPGSEDFPPLGSAPVVVVVPAEVSQQVSVRTEEEEEPKPEAPKILSRPRPAEPAVTEDDMMAFFMQ